MDKGNVPRCGLDSQGFKLATLGLDRDACEEGGGERWSFLK